MLTCRDVLCCVVLSLLCGVVTGSPYVAKHLASEWAETTTSFYSTVPTNNSTIQGARFLAVADWYHTMNPNLVAVNEKAYPLQLELWGSSAITNSITSKIGIDTPITEKLSTELKFKWRSKAVKPPKAVDGNRIVGALVADFTRRGQLDFIIQDAEGNLYYMNGNEDINREDGGTSGESSALLTVHNPRAVDLTVKHSQSPLLSLANLIGVCGAPDLVYVNRRGEVVVLTLMETLENNGTTPRFDANCVLRDSSDKTKLSPFPVYEAFLLSDLLQKEEDKELLHLVPETREVNPFSLSMEDINGDCLAELVFTVRDVQNAAVEVFMVSPGKRQQLRLERLLTLEESCGEEELCYYGTPTVADVTGDGVPDITFPVCSQEHQTEDSDALFAEGCVAYEGVQVFRNQLEASKACAKAGGAPGPYGFATERSTTTVLKAASCGFTDEVLLTTSLKEPLLLRPLDYNRDGVTDLAVPSTQGPLLLSGTGGVFDCTPVDSSKAVDDTTYQASIPFFLSLEVLGRFELLLNSPTNNTVYTHHNIPQRHYFLLASALNGVYGEKQNQFALTQTGAVHYWSWQDIHMKSHYNLQTQAARTGVRALSPPRVFAGLGVTFSYVEHYTVGTAVAGDRRYRRFPSYLIPNSQVFAVLHPIQQDSEWSLQLYVPTSQYKLLLLVVLLSTLTILGIPIACMRWSELRSDMREWRLL